LVLPHGGLRKSDGTAGLITDTDLRVQVAGESRKVVNPSMTAGKFDPSAADEVRVEPAVGLLVFGSPLPASGIVTAEYVLGQWERRVTKIGGVLRIDFRADAPGPVIELSAHAVAALLETPPALRGLQTIGLTALTAVGLPDELQAGSRGRTALFAFDYEHIVDRPDSSGGIIREIHITKRIRDPLTESVIVV
jgi:hypothetical protein